MSTAAHEHRHHKFSAHRPEMKTHSSPTLSPATPCHPAAGAVPVAQVAHGLNNTLTVINGFSDLLLGVMTECDPHRRYVEEIERAGQHAAELIQQLLTRAEQTAPPPAGKARPTRALRELAHDHSHHKTILLVDDDDAVRDAVRHELAVLGHTVIEASSGLEALRLAEGPPRRRIDLLLTDVAMPEMDGCLLAARLREHQPELKVLFTSGYAQDVALQHSPHRSHDGFLPKPYNAATLVHSIAAVLGQTPPAGCDSASPAQFPGMRPGFAPANRGGDDLGGSARRPTSPRAERSPKPEGRRPNGA